MHLKSITLRGFKSFPGRTKLEFGRGVSVIVGPNGSGKSNITDGVLWALGEQSPTSVRGQSMQDLIFAGGHGVKGRNSAEVEVVIDNEGGLLASEFSEISISRSLDRSGEGIYRLNGARCRLIDVIEVLSDTGLGKEMHSVISQGKVEQIVVSKPHDRTALVEEAAGLSKHRKRRHRAQLKLNRTQDNLDRALDVEREARSRLRPLKRQAEAAELHARLERQSLELRGTLTAEQLGKARSELAEAEGAAVAARSRRDRHEASLMETAHERERVERSFAEHGQARERLSDRVFGARSAAERISIRLESVRERLRSTEGRLERSRRALDAIGDGGGGGNNGNNEAGDFAGRLSQLERELERLDSKRARRLDAELSDSEVERQRGEKEASALEIRIEETSSQLERTEQDSTQARERRSTAVQQASDLERECARLELECSALDERIGLAPDHDGPTIADLVSVDEGFEGALAGALAERLRTPLAADLAGAERIVERGGEGGARALVGGGSVRDRATARPAAGAIALLDHVHPRDQAQTLVEALLVDAWIVTDFAGLPDDFTGIAVTRAGAAFNGSLRELRRLPRGDAGGLGDRRRREEIARAQHEAGEQLAQAAAQVERASMQVRDAESRRDSLEVELRELRRRREEALETARRAEWLIEQRREHSVGPDDARRAELAGEISAERRMVERLDRELAERAQHRERLKALIAHDVELVPAAKRTVAALDQALEAVGARRASLEAELSAGEAVGEQAAARLRELARSEYELQAQLREASEMLTQQEVRVAQVRDREQAVAQELDGISQQLGIELECAQQPLADTERDEAEVKLERLERRRERIGPVNPLAEREYDEAIAHVEELEEQRKDLEAALAELQGLIRETDRRIREAFEETFEAAARNFEEVIEQLFPGGRGRLRRVSPPAPKLVLGGAEQEAGDASEEDEGPGSEEQREADEDSYVSPGIEIEVTPAGKVPKRLSLLSGGEKSLVALAFMFAVFLARPCPFYVLDEVEAALDDTNIDRFLGLVRRFSDRAQFIVITHQRRTMEAADVIYGVSMASDGVSKVVSRKMESDGSVTDRALIEAA
ncbi:MAG: AAA family ATPase [Solirubrobacterales bacterium]